VQVFDRYLMPGGEECSVARIASHLELAGHHVTRFWRATEEWQRLDAPPKWRQPFLAWNNTAVLQELRELHERIKPDIWILHNIVPVVSLGVYRLARDLGVPVIRWLHNYRPLSPSGTLRARGKSLSADDPLLVWKEILGGTWHGPFLTAWLALGYARIKWRGDLDLIQAWIAISNDVKRTFELGGFPANKIHVLRHSWDIQPPLSPVSDDGHFLFLGRMTEDKGVHFLIELWSRPEFRNATLVMAGQGPLADRYRGQTPPNIRWTGHVRGEEKRRLIAGCRAVLFPCLWSEPLGLVVYEAFEQARPVIASNLGGLKDLITDGQTGRLLAPGMATAWSEVLQQLIREPETSRTMGEQGLKWLHQNVSPQAWIEQFNRIAFQILRK
jgi:glycosyltransferase involved in cell wall biosynthesis